MDRQVAFGLMLITATVALPAAAQAADEVVGLWSNPKQSVFVRTDKCGDRLCGEIVCASPKAVAKARAKGTEQLIGTRVFENFEQRRDGTWRGKLFVPDRGGRFQSTLKVVDRDRIEVRGCMFGGLLCKAQTWQRAEAPACQGGD